MDGNGGGTEWRHDWQTPRKRETSRPDGRLFAIRESKSIPSSDQGTVVASDWEAMPAALCSAKLSLMQVEKRIQVNNNP